MKTIKRMSFPLYNALLCVLAAVIFVSGVLCVQAAEEKWYLKWDVSSDAVTELSPYTRARLDALDADLTVTLIRAFGSSDTLIELQTETLMKMASVCGRITVETVDPVSQPQALLALAGDAAGVKEGTVFVRNQAISRTVRVDADEFLFARRIGGEEYAIYCGEAMIVGGIDRAVDENPASVLFVTGHGEPSEQETAQFRLQCRAMGLELSEGALTAMTPKSRDVIALIAPVRDLTDAETQALKAHLYGGARLLIACGADTPLDRMTNLSALCDLYGLGFRLGWTVENPAETSRFVDEPSCLSPALAQDNGILDELPGRLILPRACALAVPSPRPYVTANILLTTSDRAILKRDVNARDASAAQGDESGRFPLAVFAQSEDTAILQLADAQMLLTGVTLGGSHVLDASENLAFLSACLEVMTDAGGGASLEAGVKQFPSQLITFQSEREQRRVSMVLLFALPFALTVAMGMVVLQRRHL